MPDFNAFETVTPTLAPPPGSTKLAWALWMAARGFHVFPLQPNTKIPLSGSNGHLDATTDPDLIRRTWTDPNTGQELDWNIGATPRDGRHVVIDLDVKGGVDGIAAYEALGGEIAGLVVRTTTGGLHVYCTTMEPLRTTAGRVAPGVDSRSGDGYVVAPGSALDGKTYEIISNDSPLPVPQFIAEKIGTRAEHGRARGAFLSVADDQPRNLERALQVARSHPPAGPGSFHDLGFRLGAELARVAVSPEKAVEIAETEWISRNTGGYTSRDRFVSDLQSGYDAAVRDGQHGQHSVDAQLATFAGVNVAMVGDEAPSNPFGQVVLPDPEDEPAPLALAPGSALVGVQENYAATCMEVRQTLAQTMRGDLYSTIANLALILKGDPLLANLVGLDAFANRVMIARSPPPLSRSTPAAAGPYPRELRDDDATRMLAYLQQRWCPDFRGGDLAAALDVEAHDNSFHPVQAWLNSLTWDGVPRIENWLCAAFGCADTAYHRAIGSKWLVAAVRRVRQPGCKFDYLPVLQGDQGIGKSRALAALFGQDWFSDQLPDNLAGKDAPIALAGKWCVELGEITQLVKNETETVKAFLSRQVDRYRPPYGRLSIDVPRQSVLIGTTNPGDYLRDPTGNRRFWPVECGKRPADIAWLEAHRSQLWAEAAHREAEGASIWLDDDGVRGAAEAAQAAAMEEDVWTDRVLGYLAGRAITRVAEVLSVALGVPTANQDKRSQMRVARIMRIAGWFRNTVRDRGQITKAWCAPAGWVQPPGPEALDGGFDPFVTT